MRHSSDCQTIAYTPLVKPPDPLDLQLSPIETVIAQIPIVGWQWSATRWNKCWKPTWRRLKSQLEERGPVPSEIWGDDYRRRELAVFIAGRIREEFGWPNDRFIPQDSFWVMAFPPYDDLCGVEVLMDIEDRLGVTITEAEADSLTKMTFGEAVDFLLGLAGEGMSPLNDPDAMESRLCPSASIFWDLRAFAAERAGVARHDMRPNARLRELFAQEDMYRTGQFVARRFGVSCPVRKRVFGVLPVLWTGFIAYALFAVGTYSSMRPLFWWYMLFAPLVLAVALHWLARWVWVQGLVTVADLVRWVLDNRQRARRLLARSR